jgi:hypothetical protein
MAKAPEKTAGLFGDEKLEPEAACEAEPKATEWLDLPEPPKIGETVEFPYNGAAVTLLSPGRDKEVAAVWRSTRAFRDGRWIGTHFWAIRNGGGQCVPFQPAAYRKFEEPMFVPKKAVK